MEVAKIDQIAKRLRELKGPGDGKGAFLGNGVPSRTGNNVELRSFEIAELLELLAGKLRDS